MTGRLTSAFLFIVACDLTHACQCRRIVPEDFLFEQNDYGYIGEVKEVTALPANKDNCLSEMRLKTTKILHGVPPEKPTVVLAHAWCPEEFQPKNHARWTNCDEFLPPPRGTFLRVFGKDGEVPFKPKVCDQAIEWVRPPCYSLQQARESATNAARR